MTVVIGDEATQFDFNFWVPDSIMAIMFIALSTSVPGN